MKFSFKSFAIGFACAALSLGAVTYANAAGDATIKACANKTTGVMRYISKGSCKKTETLLSWNQRGSQGLPGATGAKGETGAAGAKGDAGAAGAKGDAGAAGAKGEAGAAGTNGSSGTNGANTNSQIKNICGANGTTACAIGLKGPGGGIVFITPSTRGNTTGLFYEASPSTWASSAGNATSSWCSNTTGSLRFDTALFYPGVMEGAYKTAVMLGDCFSGAATLADEYTATVNDVVYGDWFLPSIGEMREMFNNRAAIGGLGSSVYWSSTEHSATSALTFGFDNNPGGPDVSGKANQHLVRPVRAF